MKRKLKRITDSDHIGGVCAGIGYWIQLPIWVIRLIFIFSFVVHGTGLLLYIALWIVLPEWEEVPEDFEEG